MQLPVNQSSGSSHASSDATGAPEVSVLDTPQERATQDPGPSAGPADQSHVGPFMSEVLASFSQLAEKLCARISAVEQ